MEKTSHSTTMEDLPKSWENKILVRLRDGGIHLVSSKGHGKTIAKMHIARYFAQREDTKVIIFDTLPNWQHRFDKCPFFVVTKDMVKRKNTQYDLTRENYIITEKDYHLSKEPFQILEQNHKVLLFSIEIQNPTEIGIFISEIISYIYNKQRIRAKYKGIQNLKTWYLFIIEEVENVFDSTSMERRAFNRIRKQYSEMANLKMACVSSSQRLQEVNTKFRGKMNYLIGRISIEDYDLKIRRLLRHSKHRKEVLNLPLGCFLNPKTNELIQFPDFGQKGKPYQIRIEQPAPKPQPQKKGIVQRILCVFISEPKTEATPQKTPQRTEQTTEESEKHKCRNCGEPITETEYIVNDGLCDNCHEEQEWDEWLTTEEEWEE